MATVLFLRGYHLAIGPPIPVLATLHASGYVHAPRGHRGKLWTVTIQPITGRGRPRRPAIRPVSRGISTNRFVDSRLYEPLCQCAFVPLDVPSARFLPDFIIRFNV